LTVIDPLVNKFANLFIRKLFINSIAAKEQKIDVFKTFDESVGICCKGLVFLGKVFIVLVPVVTKGSREVEVAHNAAVPDLFTG
jgi:hypothetical protein